MAGQLRRFTCITCETPNSAVRDGCRCTTCSRTHQLARKRVTTAAWRARRVTEPKLVLVGPTVCLPSPNPLEQDRVMSRARRQARDEAAMQEAKALWRHLEAAAKPKRGRPKKTAVQHSTDLEDAA